jgi:PP-loop superfamily ATP-utilizing enzyme
MPCCASEDRNGAGGPDRSRECESVLAGLGFPRCRVYCDGPTARIEIAPGEIARLSDPDIENRVHEAFRNRGILYVSIDLGENGIGAPDDDGLVSGAPEDI